MNMVIVVEILIGLVLLGAVVQFAVRDARRRAAALPPESEPEHTPEPPAPSSEHDAEKTPSEVADRA